MQENLTLNTKVKISDKLAFQKLVDEAIIIQPRDRKMHLLNPIGSDIWYFIEKSEEGKTVKEIIEFILQEYDVNSETANSDVFEFINKLIDKELLVIVS